MNITVPLSDVKISYYQWAVSNHSQNSCGLLMDSIGLGNDNREKKPVTCIYFMTLHWDMKDDELMV